MIEKRKVVAVVLLLAFSVGLTAGVNGLDGLSVDFADPKVRYPYLPGLGAVVLGILVHLYLIRRILPIRHTLTQVFGIMISGFLAIAMYGRLMHEIGGPGLFFSDISNLFWISIFTGWLWFPLLTGLELWANDLDSSDQKQG